MTTRIEDYMNRLFDGPISSHAGFLGAYNMGVWGVSVSGKPPLEQGLLASGNVLENVPRWTKASKDNPRAENYVKFYDTPSLWGFGDERFGMGAGIYNAIAHACGVLGISLDGGLSEKETERVQAYLKHHSGMNWNGVLGGNEDPWSEVATTHAVQTKMDQVGAWSGLVNRWKAVIAQSRYLVDITSLSPPVTGSEAQLGICAGISKCLEKWVAAASKSPETAPALMIRILFGMTAANMYGTGANTYWNEFYYQLQNTLKPFSDSISQSGAASKPIVLYGSDMGRMISTFNHSKIVAGDGQYAVVGGHNMCEEVSSNKAPVIHDITAEVTGPGAKSANAFAGSLWLKAAESGRLWIYRFNWQKKSFDDLSTAATKLWAPKNWWAYELGTQKEVPNVLKNQYWYYPMETLPAKAKCAPPEGSVPATAIMGVGRWGDTKVFGIDCTAGLKIHSVTTGLSEEQACQYAADVVKRLMIVDRKNTVIRMSQQDLINAGFFGGRQPSEHTICEMLGRRLRATPKGTAIQIIVSARFTQNSEGLAYSYGDGPREAAERISDAAVRARQASSSTSNLPARLEVLDLSKSIGSAQVHGIESPEDPSFCTIAPLAFCEARGTTRDRGSYVWPDAKYKMERIYTSGRFWNKKDKAELKFGPGNHSKVLFVSEGDDDATGLVLIGSDNMYPSPLSEFSFVIEGAEAIKAFREQYWDKLWAYSARLGFTVKSDGTVT
ncbi:MAG: hypothetical protein IPM54_02660 [Polyangiaceae bacterium]|nr:hypothetical protein [Polyangiaceae bacterium]